MAWTKTKNVFSKDPSDPLVQLNLIKTNFLHAIWGSGVPASSKEDGAAQVILSEYIREIVRSLGNSGWYTKGAFAFSGGYPANAFHMAFSRVIVDGLPVFIAGSNLNSDTDSEITLNAPPGSGTRDDLVFLEVWLAEVPGSTTSIPTTVNKPSTSTLYKYGNTQYGGTNVTDDINEADLEIRRRVQIQYRIRVVDDVDFATYVNGIDDPVVTARGGAASPGAIQFAQDARDPNLFVAGNGSTSHQSSLVSVDGFVWGIPIAKVARSVGVTTLTAPDVTDLRTDAGVLNFVKRSGDTVVGDISLIAAGARTLLVQTTSNNASSVLRVVGKTSGGVDVIGEVLSDSSGAVRVKAQSNHPLEWWTNNISRIVLTAAGVLQTAAGKVFHHDDNYPRAQAVGLTIPAAGGTVSSAHGIGSRPRQVFGHLRCTTTDQGYAVGDVVNIGGYPIDGGYIIGADATDVFFKRSSTGGPNVLNKCTGAQATINTSNWVIDLYANP